MRLLTSADLRTKFLLVLLLGVVVPLGIVGYWLARGAERSGEALLRGRLERAADQIVEQALGQWVQLRSELLDLAEQPAVLRALRSEAVRREGAVQAALGPVYAAVRGDVDVIEVRDAAGSTVVVLAPEPGPGFAPNRSSVAQFGVTLGIHEAGSGVRLGSLEAQVPVSSLLPGGTGGAGVGGSVLAAFDRRSGASLLPVSIEGALLRRRRFDWAGEPWIATQRALSEPPLDLLVAAPLGPFRAPFAEAARRGTVALAAVALAALALAALLTARITHSLGKLAQAADAVAAGDLESRVAVSSGDEVGRVAHAFNQMTESLRATVRALSQRESLAAIGEFAASLAHEVRNPLSSIRLDLQRAEERAADPASRDLVVRALRSVDRLEATVSGVLRLARSGSVARARVDLLVPLEAAMEVARPEFASRGAELGSLASTGPIVVEGDAAALEQLFLNLLLNAAQAMEHGGRAGVAVDAGDRAVVVQVWDTGPGIPAGELERVFEPFYSTRPEGTGLGLAVARRIATAHGGALGLESTRRGTTVQVRLPAAGSAGPAGPAAA